jgi:hypothetical protein
MSSIRKIIANLIIDCRVMQNAMILPVSPKKQKRTSNKSKLKQTKSRPNNKYNSSKPIRSKVVGQFRNKSNI